MVRNPGIAKVVNPLKKRNGAVPISHAPSSSAAQRELQWLAIVRARLLPKRQSQQRENHAQQDARALVDARTSSSKREDIAPRPGRRSFRDAAMMSIAAAQPIESCFDRHQRQNQKRRAQAKNGARWPPDLFIDEAERARVERPRQPARELLNRSSACRGSRNPPRRPRAPRTRPNAPK